MKEKIVIRVCRELDDLEACVALQREVWSFSQCDEVPSSMFVVATEIGGQVIGAFDDKDLVGFALTLPGWRTGNPYLYSHMLGVREPYRNAGIGRELKLFQRRYALTCGFKLIEWTFDPLEIKNSYLNFEKLGVIVRRYNSNHYGNSSSPLHEGLATDRLVAEWWVASRRVEAVLTTGKRPPAAVEMRISVPAEIYSWKVSHEGRQQAQRIQRRNRELFNQAFERELAVIGYNEMPLAMERSC